MFTFALALAAFILVFAFHHLRPDDPLESHLIPSSVTAVSTGPIPRLDALSNQRLANLSLDCSALVVDTVSIQEGQYILAKDELNPQDNGIYLCENSQLTNISANITESIGFQGVDVVALEGQANIGAVFGAFAADPANPTNGSTVWTNQTQILTQAAGLLRSGQIAPVDGSVWTADSLNTNGGSWQTIPNSPPTISMWTGGPTNTDMSVVLTETFNANDGFALEPNSRYLRCRIPGWYRFDLNYDYQNTNGGQEADVRLRSPPITSQTFLSVKVAGGATVTTPTLSTGAGQTLRLCAVDDLVDVWTEQVLGPGPIPTVDSIRVIITRESD
jgi:hypothetical protein